MATPEEFRAAFARDGVVTFPAAVVSSLSLNASDAEWLTRVGLPRSAAPFLDFGSKHEINLPTVAELWGMEDGSRYRAIGSNGSGDPIAIDTATGEIVYLNHDNGFERVFINSSVTKLAEALCAYQRLIAEAQAANGPQAYLNGNVPSESLRRFVSLMEKLDPPALRTGLWFEELDQLEGREDAG
jgi:hypothetical protein